MSNNGKRLSNTRLGQVFGGDKLILIGAIIVVYALFTALNKNFFGWTNFVNILVASHLVGLVAIGHTFLIIAGQNDLPPGSLAALSGVVMALLVRRVSSTASTRLAIRPGSLTKAMLPRLLQKLPVTALLTSTPR